MAAEEMEYIQVRGERGGGCVFDPQVCFKHNPSALD